MNTTCLCTMNVVVLSIPSWEGRRLTCTTGITMLTANAPYIVSPEIYRSFNKDALGVFPAHMYDVMNEQLPEQLKGSTFFIWI